MKEILIASEMNEFSHRKLISLIYGKTNHGKVAFTLVKGCKSKEYSDGNAFMA
jgi:hypothetical protein